MKSSTLTLACLVALGLVAAPLAEATAAHKPRHHVVRKAGVKKNTQSGGVTVGTQDVNGDGTPDVVITSPPKPKKH